MRQWSIPLPTGPLIAMIALEAEGEAQAIAKKNDAFCSMAVHLWPKAGFSIFRDFAWF